MISTKSELLAKGILRRIGRGRQQPVRRVNRVVGYYRNIDEDGENSITADMLEDDPREPIITPTGILDHRGEMMLKVIMPIKVKLGFESPVREPVEDTVSDYVPEDMLSVSDCGLGQAYADEGELSAEEAEAVEEAQKQFEAAEAEGKAVRLSTVIEQLVEQGITVLDDLE